MKVLLSIICVLLAANVYFQFDEYRERLRLREGAPLKPDTKVTAKPPVVSQSSLLSHTVSREEAYLTLEGKIYNPNSLLLRGSKLAGGFTTNLHPKTQHCYGGLDLEMIYVIFKSRIFHHSPVTIFGLERFASEIN